MSDVVGVGTDGSGSGAFYGGASGGGGGGELGRAKSAAQIRVLIEKAAMLRLERGIKEGKYMLRDQVEAEAAEKVRSVRHALQRLPRAVRKDAWSAETPRDMEKVIEEALRSVCNSFAAQMGVGDE